MTTDVDLMTWKCFLHYRQVVNSLRPRPNRRYYADDIFKCIFGNENELISPSSSLKFVPKVQINNIPALVQIMAWRRPGDTPLSEPMMVNLLTHTCVTRPQWAKWIVALPAIWVVSPLMWSPVMKHQDDIRWAHEHFVGPSSTPLHYVRYIIDQQRTT